MSDGGGNARLFQPYRSARNVCQTIQRKGKMNSITDVIRPENNLRHCEPLVVHVHHLRLFIKGFAWSPDPSGTVGREIWENILLHNRVIPWIQAKRGSEEVSPAA